MKIYRTQKAKKNILSTYDRLLDEWGVDITQIDIMTRYGSTHVNVFGESDAPPILLFHGVGDDSALMWICNAAALAPHFRLYAVDTLGGPGKSVVDNSYNKEFDDAVWIDDILDGLRLKDVNIAGVSHGGYLAQYYALVRPERVNKVVCMASSVPAGVTGSPMKTMIKIFFPEALFPTKQNIKKLLMKLTGKNSAVFTENPLILEHFSYLLRGYNNMAMRYHKVIGFSDEQIESIRSKVLYLVGEVDPFSVMGGKAALEKYEMNARFFAEVGHGINHEMADEINLILIEYFSEKIHT
ncbi:alpha/beta fold hydrolase [Gorillibacterium massiliense]|uniref:alpha/beta fold hydrolase n=1 Tax=Gorillibacterium massiliense TaxID=1280390 RepID=UPI0005946548|nr:alpha/beta fold hydrolase [Gorillibacterium massiliense]